MAKEKTEFQKRAARNVEAGKKGYVVGPKGGVDTATAIHTSGPPKTSGGRRPKTAAAPAAKPQAKSAIQQGVDAIRESSNRAIDYDKGKMGQ